MSNSSSIITRAAFLRRLALGTALIAGWPTRALAALAHRPRTPFPHPEPRPGITAAAVLLDSALPDNRAVREAYAAARAYPAIFDGLYCACRCEKSHGHRSLLSCFESDQPSGCLACQEEAELAARMVKAGDSLGAIRKAVDEAYG